MWGSGGSFSEALRPTRSEASRPVQISWEQVPPKNHTNHSLQAWNHCSLQHPPLQSLMDPSSTDHQPRPSSSHRSAQPVCSCCLAQARRWWLQQPRPDQQRARRALQYLQWFSMCIWVSLSWGTWATVLEGSAAQIPWIIAVIASHFCTLNQGFASSISCVARCRITSSRKKWAAFLITASWFPMWYRIAGIASIYNLRISALAKSSLIARISSEFLHLYIFTIKQQPSTINK